MVIRREVASDRTCWVLARRDGPKVLNMIEFNHKNFILEFKPSNFEKVPSYGLK